MKDACVKGHPYPESKRTPPKRGCAVCHRNQEFVRRWSDPERAMTAAIAEDIARNGMCPKGLHPYPESKRPGRSDCAGCHKEDQRARYHRDPEKHRAAASTYQKEHRSERNAYMRDYWQKNLLERRAYYNNRNRGRPSKRRRQEWSYLYNDPCSYCGGPTTDLDHIIPLSKGGEEQWDNLTAACGSCNKSKSNRSLLFFLLSRAGVPETV